MGDQILRFAEMIFRDRRSTPYDLASLFRGRRSTLARWSGKFTKHMHWSEPVSSAVNFHFEGSLAELLRFLMLSTSKLEVVPQKFFVLGGVKCQLPVFSKVFYMLRFGPASFLF